MDSISAPMEPLPQMPIASVDLSSEVWSQQHEASLPANILGGDSAISGKTGVSRRQLFLAAVDRSSDSDVESGVFGGSTLHLCWRGLGCPSFSVCLCAF